MLYAVGDIHGELGKLEALLAKLALRPGDRIVFLGDYVDRGPDPHGVVERLIALAQEHACVFLLGNHESMFLDFLGRRGSAYFGGDAFLANGGGRTLASYGYFEQRWTDPRSFSLPAAHEEFFRRCVLSHREGDYAFVHAGIGRRELQLGDIENALRQTRAEDLLWSRHIGELPHNLGVTIVYGHTPQSNLGVHWNSPYSIGIDTGAVYGGPLTAIRLPDEEIFQAR